MSQKEIILAAFHRGDRIKCTDAFPVYGISPHSFTRIVKELRDEDHKILDIETQPQNGGTPYKTYFMEKPRRNWRMAETLCPACMDSYYIVDGKCNKPKCGAARNLKRKGD